jgi:hypothetical protein
MSPGSLTYRIVSRVTGQPSEADNFLTRACDWRSVITTPKHPPYERVVTSMRPPFLSHTKYFLSAGGTQPKVLFQSDLLDQNDPDRPAGIQADPEDAARFVKRPLVKDASVQCAESCCTATGLWRYHNHVVIDDADVCADRFGVAIIRALLLRLPLRPQQASMLYGRAVSRPKTRPAAQPGVASARTATGTDIPSYGGRGVARLGGLNFLARDGGRCL